eukprot:UN29081
MHANAFRHAFGIFPSWYIARSTQIYSETNLLRENSLYPRAGWALKFDESDVLELVDRSCTNNIGLYFTVSNNEELRTHDGLSKKELICGLRGADRRFKNQTKELQMPRPLFTHLKQFYYKT